MALQNSLSAVGDRYAIIPTSAGSTIVVLAKSFCHGNILPDFGQWIHNVQRHNVSDCHSSNRMRLHDGFS